MPATCTQSLLMRTLVRWWCGETRVGPPYFGQVIAAGCAYCVVQTCHSYGYRFRSRASQAHEGCLHRLSHCFHFVTYFGRLSALHVFFREFISRRTNGLIRQSCDFCSHSLHGRMRLPHRIATRCRSLHGSLRLPHGIVRHLDADSSDSIFCSFVAKP